MPLPLLWIGAGVVTYLASTQLADKKSNTSVAVNPGDGKLRVTPADGAIVSCHIYGVFEHTGIWLDGNIIELKGNGLIRGISPQRFLQQRSGEEIFVACDAYAQPLIAAGAAERASSQLYCYSEYDLLKNNCHKFVWQCVSNKNQSLTSFAELNQSLADYFGQALHWQRAAV
jgi:hypothetical protein